MKLIISTIVTAIVLFILGWIIYGIILMEYFQVHMGHLIRPEHDYKVWAYAVGNLLQALMLSVIYSKFFMKGVSPAKEGLTFGFIIGLLLALPYVFYYWGGMKVTWQPVLLNGVLMGIMIVIAGLVIGLVYGKAEVPPAESTA